MSDYKITHLGQPHPDVEQHGSPPKLLGIPWLEWFINMVSKNRTAAPQRRARLGFWYFATHHVAGLGQKEWDLVATLESYCCIGLKDPRCKKVSHFYLGPVEKRGPPVDGAQGEVARAIKVASNRRDVQFGLHYIHQSILKSMPWHFQALLKFSASELGPKFSIRKNIDDAMKTLFGRNIDDDQCAARIPKLGAKRMGLEGSLRWYPLVSLSEPGSVEYVDRSDPRYQEQILGHMDYGSRENVNKICEACTSSCMAREQHANQDLRTCLMACFLPCGGGMCADLTQCDFGRCNRLQLLRLDSATALKNLVIPSCMKKLKLKTCFLLENIKLPDGTKVYDTGCMDLTSFTKLESVRLSHILLLNAELTLPPRLKRLRLDGASNLFKLNLPMTMSTLMLISMYCLHTIKLLDGTVVTDQESRIVNFEKIESLKRIALCEVPEMERLRLPRNVERLSLSVSQNLKHIILYPHLKELTFADLNDLESILVVCNDGKRHAVFGEQNGCLDFKPFTLLERLFLNGLDVVTSMKNLPANLKHIELVDLELVSATAANEANVLESTWQTYGSYDIKLLSFTMLHTVILNQLCAIKNIWLSPSVKDVQLIEMPHLENVYLVGDPKSLKFDDLEKLKVLQLRGINMINGGNFDLTWFENLEDIHLEHLNMVETMHLPVDLRKLALVNLEKLCCVKFTGATKLQLTDLHLDSVSELRTFMLPTGYNIWNENCLNLDAANASVPVCAGRANDLTHWECQMCYTDFEQDIDITETDKIIEWKCDICNAETPSQQCYRINHIKYSNKTWIKLVQLPPELEVRSVLFENFGLHQPEVVYN
eukprot:gene1050-202_t